MDSANLEAEKWLTNFLCDRHLRLCALLSLVFVLMPPEGIPGVELCVYKRWTHAPCPGCGLTRSGSNLVRGNFAMMFNYNPFGLVIVPIIFALGILGLLRPSWRDNVRRRLQPQARLLRSVYWSVIWAFVAFGVVRWLAVFQGWQRFPATWF